MDLYVGLAQEPDLKAKTSCSHLKILEKLVEFCVEDTIS
jgi:hypothetical protein